MADKIWIGLSLCIQGTLIKNILLFTLERFIPVYTGNARLLKSVNHAGAVYPCVYRERLLVFSNKSSFNGLSLCIQGTLMCGGCFNNKIRFIPVYTGNALIITYCFIIKILTVKFLPIFWDIFH